VKLNDQSGLNDQFNPFLPSTKRTATRRDLLRHRQ
jgi:hypothetical protein